MLNSDWRIVDWKFRNVLSHVIVMFELPILNQQKRGRCSKLLRDRSAFEYRRRFVRRAVLKISKTKGLVVNDRFASCNHDRTAGSVVVPGSKELIDSLKRVRALRKRRVKNNCEKRR